MDSARDPFRVLSLSYDADADAVRRAYRGRARQTHPDRGGSTAAFQEVHAAYAALSGNLEAERQRWRPAPPPPRNRYAAGLDPKTYPTCCVRISPSRDRQPVHEYETEGRPSSWRPGRVPPPGGECVASVPETEQSPAFGVWAVPVGTEHVRYVFGPDLADGST